MDREKKEGERENELMEREGQREREYKKCLQLQYFGH